MPTKLLETTKLVRLVHPRIAAVPKLIVLEFGRLMLVKLVQPLNILIPTAGILLPVLALTRFVQSLNIVFVPTNPMLPKLSIDTTFVCASAPMKGT
jgi:hypothetical protein